MTPSSLKEPRSFCLQFREKGTASKYTPNSMNFTAASNLEVAKIDVAVCSKVRFYHEEWSVLRTFYKVWPMTNRNGSENWIGVDSESKILETFKTPITW